MEEKEDDEYHQIRTLPVPDEVLSLILMKVCDPKSLHHCSLVSKHMASILSHSHSLSLQFRFKVVVNEDEFLLRWTKLLSLFTSVRSLHVKLPYIACSPGLCRQCKANYFQLSWLSKVGNKLKTFAFLSMSSMSKIDDQVEEEGSISEQPQNYSRERDSLLSTTAGYLARYATLINRTLLLLFSRHPQIESVRIMDCTKHGEVSLQGERLLKLKTDMSKSMPPNLFEETAMSMKLLPTCFCLWYAKKLRLPRSGLVMEEVTLGTGAVDEFPVWGGDIDGIVADFADNRDDIFGEALTQIHTSSHHRSNVLLNSTGDYIIFT